MINSIQQFADCGIKVLEQAVKDFAESKDLSAFIGTVNSVVVKLGQNVIKEELEYYDQLIRERPERLEHWVVVRKDPKALITSLGTVNFKKTLYKNKETGENVYLLDSNLGLDPDMRMTDDAVAKLLEEAVQTSYRKGGEAVNQYDKVTKQTVKNKIHDLDFSKVPKKKPAVKKAVPYLYIEADEDHDFLQFNDKRGDLEKDERGYKQNCIMTKIVYVHEGVEKVSPDGKRRKLVNPYYFCGTYPGKENDTLWQEVYDYIDDNYDLTKIKKVYLNSDGGSWIKGAETHLHGLTKVLDEFHIEKALTTMTAGLLDSRDDARQELREAIRSRGCDEFGKLSEKIINLADSDTRARRIIRNAEYVLGNWTPAKTRLKHAEGVIGCSAEGHVSHILADRMSSRPLGWSRKGADKIAHLRAYYFNGGDMLELVKAQALPRAVGSENEIILDPRRIEDESLYPSWGKYADLLNHSVSAFGQKQAWLSAGISYI